MSSKVTHCAGRVSANTRPHQLHWDHWEIGTAISWIAQNAVPKLSREKTFANFAVLWLFAKVFSTKFGGVAPLALQKRATCESFLHENRIFHQFAKVFSLESFPLYGNFDGSISSCSCPSNIIATCEMHMYAWQVHHSPHSCHLLF